ncbi:MAG: 4Fe-4S binding protein [Oscillospiraceae bacterium]|jgi:2-oxoglutarate ferredoxin oxidoreductase subunit delta|nr:4Fe-4S binding protein [Oscillospiraceae bacterium]
MSVGTRGDYVKATVTVNEELCKGCALCVGACPKALMTLDGSPLNAKGYKTARCADEAACIACAFCAVMCPDSAITVEKEV